MALKDLMARGEREVANLRRTPAPTELPATVPTPAAAPIPRTISPSTSVDAESELEGTLRCRDILRIDGRIKGRIECEKSVLIGERAHIEASITGEEVTVAGSVKGDITAGRKITLEKTAVVTGDLTTPGVVIEEGAKVCGRILIGTDEPSAAARASSDTTPERAEKSEPKAEARPKSRADGRRPAAGSGGGAGAQSGAAKP